MSRVPALEQSGRQSFISDNLSLGRALGLQAYTFRRILLLTSCILAVFQYGMVLTNGVSIDDFNTYYGLTSKQGDTLYSFLNFGACALSFIPGLCYDRFGCVLTMIVGTLVFDAGIGLQLVWTKTFPAWLSTMDGLKFCYICFGFSSSFFNVIGSFAPLQAYPAKHIGKVSACVQVCMSLGITVQTWAYYIVKSAVGDGKREEVEAYLWYTLIFTNVTGIFMCIIFRVCHNVLTSREVEEAINAEELISSEVIEPKRTLFATLLTPDFVFAFCFFFIAVGFSFSFLNVEARIASEVDVSSESLATTFGVLNALGRLSVSIPLDYTRHHPLGGVLSYLFLALVFFTIGMMFLAFPASPTSTHVYLANALVSYGYGGMLGIVPPALRLRFGTENLGVIYGVLYIGVSISEPIWSYLFVKADDCIGVECYRTYCVCCVSGFALQLALTLMAFHFELKRRPRHSSMANGETAT